MIASPRDYQALIDLIDGSWDLASRVLATLLVPNASSTDVGWFSRFQTEATFGETAMLLLQHQERMDVSEVLPLVKAPTLVLHNRLDESVPIGAGREIAALVPDALFHELEGNEHDPFIRDAGSLPEIVLASLDGRPIESVTDALPPRFSARGSGSGNAGPPLTARETQVLRLIAAGEPNKRIAADLNVTVATVERHVTNLYRKIDARGRADAARVAIGMGLAEPIR